MVDVDTHPRGGLCRAAGTRPVPADAALGQNVVYVPLEPESVTISCTFDERNGASRTVERTLYEEEWSAYKRGMVLGALLGGGIIGAAAASADKPDDNFHYYPFILNVAHPDFLIDPENVETAVSEFERKWDRAVDGIVRACVSKGGSQKRCYRERDREFFDRLKSLEIDYLTSFTAAAPPPAGAPGTDSNEEADEGADEIATGTPSN